jgi:hypothetical protein
MREYEFLRQELVRRHPELRDQAVILRRLVVSRGYHDALITRYSIDYPSIPAHIYRWIEIGNQNEEWEILDLQIEAARQPIIEESVYDVVFD